MTGKTRVLVVDDEPAILRFLKPALEANSYEIETAGTVADATKLIASKSPDIVVLDLGLPDGDGKDVIRRVREWSDVPIIVLSARDREIERSRRSISAPTTSSISPSGWASSWRACERRSGTACSARRKRRYSRLVISKSTASATR